MALEDTFCFVTSNSLFISLQTGRRLSLCHSSRIKHPVVSKRVFITALDASTSSSSQDENPNRNSSSEDSPFKKFKFDPKSNTDAFGRDPKKETEFWMASAKDVLASNEVRDAIDKYTKDNPDNLTEEQRAYNEFIKQMDEENRKRGE